MRYLRFAGVAALLLTIGLFGAGNANAQRVAVGIGIGGPAYAGYGYGYGYGAPACAYGYYGYAPYSCAPYGYYGPDWFVGGVFIGAGPWFHGSNDFHGKVDNSFDPQHGYSGPMPKVGDKPAAQRRSPDQFKGNEVRDGRGHAA
jgi:hypothetical protein